MRAAYMPAYMHISRNIQVSLVTSCEEKAARGLIVVPGDPYNQQDGTMLYNDKKRQDLTGGLAGILFPLWGKKSPNRFLLAAVPSRRPYGNGGSLGLVITCTPLITGFRHLLLRITCI